MRKNGTNFVQKLLPIAQFTLGPRLGPGVQTLKRYSSKMKCGSNNDDDINAYKCMLRYVTSESISSVISVVPNKSMHLQR